MTTPDVPLLDIAPWRDGTARQRERVASRMDQALQDSGFLLIEPRRPGRPARPHPRRGARVLRAAGRTEGQVRHPGRRPRLDPAEDWFAGHARRTALSAQSRMPSSGRCGQRVTSKPARRIKLRKVCGSITRRLKGAENNGDSDSTRWPSTRP